MSGEWISVEDRLPARCVDVQVFCSDTREQMVAFLVGNGQFQFGTYPADYGFSGRLMCSPTHWMPLPPPPA